ncbi:MAG: lamin tail domain-containing protein [Flavobacteriales bacterium]|nr:lamin tail domain-containing protein [Flavobacteriales bacterium]
MKKSFLFFILISFPLLMAAQFSDDFSDGDFTNNPIWIGDIDKFEVNASGLLHHLYDTISGESSLVVVCQVSKNAVWEFDITLLFDPSSSNFSKVFLMSDETDLTSDLNGYFVKIGGESGNIDNVSLFSKIGNIEVKIIDGIDGIAASNPNLKIKVTRDDIGNWELFVDTSNYSISQGVAFHDAVLSSEYFGVFCKYSKTRSDLFFFDNFNVSGSWDTIVPQNINPNDVVINELFVDPIPSIGLPEYEYIELFNITDKDINLTNWTITIGSTEKVFPISVIKADSFVVLLKQDVIDSFPSTISKIGFSSISLTNSAEDVILKDENGKILHSVSYTDSWYNDENKTEGGWSIEQVNPDLYCEGKHNWRASVSAIGGSPGKQNSVFGEYMYSEPLKIQNLFLVNSNTLTLKFNKKLDSNSIVNQNQYFVDKGVGNPIFVSFNTYFSSEINLHFSDNFMEGFIYNLSINDVITDCNNNQLDTSLIFRFVLPDSCLQSDIIINEILFDPKDDGVDYVEIYNNSDKVFDLKNYRLSNYLIDWNTPENWKIITNESRLIFPDEYWVLTTDSAKVKNQYFTENPCHFIELVSLPTFSNEEGTVAIIHQSLLNTIDVLGYHSDMHHPLLNSVDGVSLERISPNLEQWQSASSTSGYGTPTYQNSQYFIPNSFGEVTVIPEVFSPNNDGYEDFLSINWEFERSDLMASISVYNSDGILINVLINNELIGNSGTQFWNGTDERGMKLSSGIYIVLLDVLSDDGFVNQFKKVVVLHN